MMACSKHLSIFFLLTLLGFLKIEARDNQMFNKIPSKTNELENQIPLNKDAQNNPMNNPKEQQPDFIPETEQNYGLYDHQSVNLPPSSVTSNNNKNDDFPNNPKYLPKNYNPVAYVTEPEDFSQDSTYTNTPMNNNNNNGANNYYNAHQQNVKVFDFTDRDEDSSTNNNNYYKGNDGNNNYNNRFMDASFSTNPSTNNNNYYKGNDENNKFNNYNNRFMDSSYKTDPSTNHNNYNRYGGRVNRVQPQGMSDTRFLENGRYYYDINAEKYSVHPNDNAMAMRNQYHPRGTYGNHNPNSYQYNNYNDEQVQYQDDDNMP